MKYTLVRNSNLGTSVQLMAANSADMQQRVLSVGGLVFDTYEQADNAEYISNYRGIVAGRIAGNATPNGTFSKKVVGGEDIFVPSTEFKTFLRQQ